MRPPPGWTVLVEESKTFESLVQQLHQLAMKPKWFFRGEPDQSFPTGQPAIGRLLAADAPTPLQGEVHMLGHFMDCASHQLDFHQHDVCDSVCGWLMLAQHHGMPTRFLDWTLSPWVAAYFAASEFPDRDGWVWCFDPQPVYERVPPSNRDCMNRALNSKLPHQFCTTIQSLGPTLGSLGLNGGTSRMVAQRGVYTVGHPASLDHLRYIGEARVDTPGLAMALSIPAKHKRPLMQMLWSMNIHAGSLFPGLDGVGRMVRSAMMYALDLPVVIPTSDSNPL